MNALAEIKAFQKRERAKHRAGRTPRTPQQTRAAKHIGAALQTIGQFDRKCNRAQYTDIGECWEVIYQIRDTLRKAARLMRSGEPREESPKCKQTACRHCGLDIEGFYPYRRGEWRDRGNNATCPSGEHAGKLHAPVIS